MKLKKRIAGSERGNSMVEVVIILVTIGILSGITAGFLGISRKYNAENQAITLIDFMREAQQRAISQKRTIRVEINSTRRIIRLINENEPADINNDGVDDPKTANNDTVIKTAAVVDNNIFVGVTPTNMIASPVELSPVPPTGFSNSVHPLSLGDLVTTLRFKSNGTVTNGGTNAVGAGAVPTGATIYVWTKKDSDPANTTVADILRAVTVLGSSGSTKMWKCAVVSGQCSNWTR